MRDRIFALMIVIAMPLAAQPPQGGRGGPPQSPQTMAPVDLTGYWVSVVNEDWRFRMVMPPPGDYQGVPMTPAAVKVADAWDPAKDEAAGDQCKAYGAPALLRVPEHLHFTWDSSVSFRRLEAPRGPADSAGRFCSRVGISARPRQCRS